MTTRSDKAGAAAEEHYKKGYRYNFSAGDYMYEESLAPNHVHLWMALCLHADALDKHSGPLKLHIPDTLIYGFGKNPIWLHTDDKGQVNKKIGDDCSEEKIFTSFSGPGVVALDKEPALVPCINPASDFEAQATVRYDGTFVCPLSAPSLRRLLLKPRQHPPRVFSIQKVIQTKYGDHSTVVRVCHHRGGLSSTWSMTRREPFMEKTASPSKQRRLDGAAECSSTAVSPKGNAYTGSMARSESAQYSYNGSEVVLELKIPDSPSSQLRRMDTVVTLGTPTADNKNYWSKTSFYKSKTFESSDVNTPSKRLSVSEQNIEDITNLYDDNVQFSAEEPKRFLDSLSDRNCMINEVKPLAAEPIVEIAESMCRHFSVIFHRRLEELTIDVAKDDKGNYCVVDIVAFKFENIDSPPVKFPNRVKNRVEFECDCILDPFRSHLDPAQVHAMHKTCESKDLHKASGIDWSAQAMGACPCSMCESKLPPEQLCYAITSTLIQSTIVHMRSRLPQKYWPSFCRDSCYAVRSMLRIEGDPFNINGLTVADIRICGLCFEICNKEMALIEIEQKLSKFTRTTNDRPPGVSSPKAPLTRTVSSNNDLMSSEGLKGVPNSPPKPDLGASNWNPTENFRMRNRPSVVAKIAGEQTKKNGTVKHQPKMRPTRSTMSKVDLMRTQLSPESYRPKSAGAVGRRAPPVLAGGSRSPVKTSPIRRRPPPGSGEAAAPDAHIELPKSMASASKSMKTLRPGSSRAAVEDQVPADGRRVVRSSVSQDLTMCRALVGIQQIKDLPVIIFEHFENFRVHYNVLGRDVDFPAVKKSKYYRKDAYRYKTFTVDGENDSVSLSSAGSDGNGSEFEDDADDRAAMFNSRSRSGRLAKVSEEDVDAEEYSSEDTSQEDVSIVVGTLAVQRMRVTYTVIPGDSAGGAPSPELERYFARNRRILVVLCGDTKDGANICDETRWMSPPEGFSSASKAQNLQHSLTNIRLDAVNKTLFQGKYSGVNSLRQKHLSRMFRKSYQDNEIPSSSVRKTERGEILPEGSIAYGYVNYYQFLNATVNRIDIVTPMTYALSHVPRERSVPMLKAVVGFERLYFPVDKLSLPYSLVNVGHSKGYDAYVAELEDQLSSSEPLPAEWLVTGAQDDSSSSRRKAVATTLQMKSVQESSSAFLTASKLDIDSDIYTNAQATEFASNLVDGKRIAPVKFHHESRSENKVLENRSEKKVKNFKDEEEVRERNPNSLWCFSAHIVSGHHMGAAIPEHMQDGSSELHWNYKFKFLGETTNCDCNSTNEYGFDEVLRFNSLTKHFFLGDIAALEDMFSNMEPIDFELKLMENAIKGERRPSNQIVVRQKAAGIRGPAVLAIPNENAFAQRFTGSFSLNEFKGQRFFESTLLLTQQIEVGLEKPLYPPYIFAEFHFFRMGGENGLASIPRNLALGKEVVTGVRRVVRKNKLMRTSSFTPVET